jgi:hypothetical protein
MGRAAAHLTLVPCVRVTSVLPALRTVNMVGALMSYQSFLAKGSELRCGAAGGAQPARDGPQQGLGPYASR